MARDRKAHARAREVSSAAPPAAAMPSNVPIAPVRVASQYQDQILALVRALALDAAQVDHEADLLGKNKNDASRKLCGILEKKNDNITCSCGNLPSVL
jgi:predicted ATP-grasp superfamily ATP-dependent carboligase